MAAPASPILFRQQILHIVVHEPELAQIAGSGVIEPLARRGQLDAVCLPVKKRGAQLFLQGGDLPGNGGGYQVVLLGRSGKDLCVAALTK